MQEGWCLINTLTFKDIGSFVMLVEFTDKRDKEHVICEGPWSFDKNLVLTSEVGDKQLVHQIKFMTTLFWIRLHDLLLMGRNEPMGRLIKETIGKVLEVDVEEYKIAWGSICGFISKLIFPNLYLRNEAQRGNW